MEKIIIEGINGYFEIRNKYVYIFFENKKSFLKEEHYVWYEEIEDVMYKKPTSDLYGYLTIYSSSKNKYTSEPIKYKLILDKIDEKNLDSNKKIYEILKAIASKNNSVKIEEVTDEEKNVIEEDNTFEVGNKVKEESKEEVVKEVKDNNEVKDQPSVVGKPFEDKEGPKVLPEIPIIPTENPSVIKTADNKINPQEIEENKIQEQSETEQVHLRYDDNENIINKNENLSTINILEKKLDDLENKLKVIDFKTKILDNYTDEANEKKEIESLVLEIKKLIDELEKIKKEVSDEEKKLFEKDFLYLEKGNVIITHLNEKLVDEENRKDLEEYLETYKHTIKKIEEIDKKVEVLDTKANTKKDEINIADEQYEKDLNKFLNVKSNFDYIKKYREEALEDLKKVKHEIETTVEPMTRFRYVRTGITNQTRRMYALMGLNALRPLGSRTLSLALMLSTSILTIRDILGYETIEEHYNRVTQTDTLVGLENVDIETSKNMLSSSIEEIDKILNDCENKYKDYPDFDKLKKDLLDFKEELSKENEEIKKVSDKVSQLSKEEKVKVLRYNE